MSLVSEGTFWTVAPTYYPEVQAWIYLDYHIGDEHILTNPRSNSTIGLRKIRANHFSRLVVPLYCSLMLICNDSYPLVWQKDWKPIQDQDIQESYKWFGAPLENLTGFGDHTKHQFDQYKLPIYRRYDGSLTFRNVTSKTEGFYTCGERTQGFSTKGDVLRTTIELVVDETPVPTADTRQPQILTSWFETCTLSFGYNYTFDFLYFAPLGLNFTEYFIFPGNKVVAPSQEENGITVESDYYHIGGGSKYIRYASLKMLSRSEHEGNYTFVIEYYAPNGTMLKIWRTITLKALRYSYNLAERPLTDQFRTYLMVGRYYKLTFWSAYVEPVISAEISAYSQSTQGCVYHPVTVQMMPEECGVISVIKKVLLQPAWINAVDINLRATRSCNFVTHVWSIGNVTQDITTYLNITTIEETFSDKDFSDKEGERTIVVSLPDGKRGSSTKLTNQNLTLRCLVPTCDWEVIGWCKQKCRKKCAWLLWRNDEITFEGHVADDPGIKVSFLYLSNYTIAFDLHFHNLRVNQTGEYGCGAYKPVYKPRRLGDTFQKWIDYPEFQFSLPFVNFRLGVLEPKQPYFTTGNQNETLKNVIKRGEKLDLACPVDALPSPGIIWKRYQDGVPSDEGKFTIIAESENTTTLTIYEPGTYECFAKNDYGENSRRFAVAYESEGSTLPIALAIPAAAIVISLAIGLLVWMRRRANAALFRDLAKMLQEKPVILPDDNAPLNDQTSLVPYNRKYEIDRDLFKLIKRIGDGEFGQVFIGELQTGAENSRLVAVKIPKDPLNLQHHQTLIAELKIMNHLRPHVNVLSLVGACTADVANKQLFVLTELCEKGSLLDHLQKHALDFENGAGLNDGALPPFGIHTLLNYAYQASNGMENLAAQNIIHRDLALRNLLLTRSGLIKISDFGLSRHKETVYDYNKFYFRNVKLPIPWMAPESILKFEYTHKSDVWSFGIVLWEMFSCGRVPYSRNIGNTNLITWLIEGHRLAKPDLATERVYNLMLDCWNDNSKTRPTFSECKRCIAQHLEKDFPSSYASLLVILSEAWANVVPNDLSSVNQEENEPLECADEPDVPNMATEFIWQPYDPDDETSCPSGEVRGYVDALGQILPFSEGTSVSH